MRNLARKGRARARAIRKDPELVEDDDGGVPGTAIPTPAPIPIKAGRTCETLRDYAEKLGRSEEDLLRLALGTYAVLCDEMFQQNRVFIATPSGKVISELTLPTKHQHEQPREISRPLKWPVPCLGATGIPA